MIAYAIDYYVTGFSASAAQKLAVVPKLCKPTLSKNEEDPDCQGKLC